MIRHRDFIRVKDFYFSVVGYRHDRCVKCILRYVPCSSGSRSINGRRYRKLRHSEALKYFREFCKNGLHCIPRDMIDEVYRTDERFLEVCMRDVDVRKVAEFFKLPKMGITGSRLIGLKGEDSDVDLVLYDRYFDVGRKKIEKGLMRGVLEQPDLEFVYRKRCVNIPFEVFRVHEIRKYNRAVLDGICFDILYVRDKILGGEIEEIGRKICKTTLRARVLYERSFDYPAFYLVDRNVRAVLSFTHTYSGQVFRGEIMEARGFIEEIDGERYLIVGTRREVEDEYIVSISLLERLKLLEEFLSWKKS